jgi:hypothetical protein
MADLLVDFETYFVAKGVASVVYKDIAPDQPDILVALYEYEGSNPVAQIDGSSRSIQVMVRDVSAAAAKLKIKGIYNSLITEDGILDLTDTRWCTIYLKQPPFKMKVDESNRSYYVFNVAVTTYID